MAVSNARASAAADPGERVLVITRVFDAPRELIWKLWTDPAHAKHWMGPRGFTATHFEQDPRPGGAWRGCLRQADDSRELWQGGVFREIVEPERLVYTFAWDREDGSRARPAGMAQQDHARPPRHRRQGIDGFRCSTRSRRWGDERLLRDPRGRQPGGGGTRFPCVGRERGGSDADRTNLFCSAVR